MLSILIPVYNYNLLSTVQELQKQCIDCGIIYEILCQDDGSNSLNNIQNESINKLKNCKFIALTSTIAHRENRNSLARQSKYQYLLFIDGDSKIISDKYIFDYLSNINDFDVVYGGRIHPKICPSVSKKLRWKYGIYVEDKKHLDRCKSIYQSLLFNNTLIKKDVFNLVKFDTSLVKYGHDDTQFSYQLMLKKVKILHIENPVEHNDLDTNLLFYSKMKNSLENLYYLFKNNKIDKSFSKLVYLIEILKKFKLLYFVGKIYVFFENKIEKNLIGKNPKLWVFNIFRIGYLSNYICRN